MIIGDATRARIEKFRSTAVFRGDSPIGRILIMGYSWGFFTFLFLSIFEIVSKQRNGISAIDLVYFIIMFVVFLFISPLFGILMSQISENRNFQQKFAKSVFDLVANDRIDLENPTVLYWCPAVLVIPFKGSFNCVIRIMEDMITIDYFEGLKFLHRSIECKKPLELRNRISLNPFFYILFRKDTLLRIGKYSVRSNEIGEIREKIEI